MSADLSEIRTDRAHRSTSPAQVLRRARGAAVLTQHRLQVAIDPGTGRYRLRVLPGLQV